MTVNVVVPGGGASGSPSYPPTVLAAAYGFAAGNTAAANTSALQAARDAAGSAAVANNIGAVELPAGNFSLNATSMVASNSKLVKLIGQGREVTALNFATDSGAGSALLDWGTGGPVSRTALAEGFTLYGPGTTSTVGVLPAGCDGIRIPGGTGCEDVRVLGCNAGFVGCDDHCWLTDCKGYLNWYGRAYACAAGNAGNWTIINCDFTRNMRASVAMLAPGGARGYQFWAHGEGDLVAQEHVGFSPVGYLKETLSVTATTNGTTSVTAISPALPVGTVCRVFSASASDVAVGTTLTITGTGSTGTLSQAATGSNAGETLGLGDPNTRFVLSSQYAMMALESIGNAVFYSAQPADRVTSNTFGQAGESGIPDSGFKDASLPSDYAVLKNVAFTSNICHGADWLFAGVGSSGAIDCPAGFQGNALHFNNACSPPSGAISPGTGVNSTQAPNRIFSGDGSRGRLVVASSAGAITANALVQYDSGAAGYKTCPAAASTLIAGVALSPAPSGGVFYLADGGLAKVLSSTGIVGSAQAAGSSGTVAGQVAGGTSPTIGTVVLQTGGSAPFSWWVQLQGLA